MTPPRLAFTPPPLSPSPSPSTSFLRPFCYTHKPFNPPTPPTPIASPPDTTSRCVIPSAANARRPRPSQPNSSHRSLANLHELTERIADLLQLGNINKSHLHCPKDAPLGYLSATTHVAVVFGKHLIRDQITVEYAKRIVTLVKQIAAGAFRPDVICFTGGRGLNKQNSISEATAGYAFFRNLCEEAGVDVSAFDFILEQQSRDTKGNLRNVIEELRRRSGSDAVSACHFTLLSSDYHLIRIQEVHRLSPRQSILFPLEVSNATWNCIFAAYPFCVSRDPATAFLGRAVVLANDLGILLVNLNGVLDHREFLAKDNLHRLNETFAKMREMYRVIDSRTSAQGGFSRDMRTYAETLELAIHDIREVYTLLSPLNETGASIPRAHLELARQHLASTIKNMRASMDPDRVLRVHDRMAIIDDIIAYVSDLDSPRPSSASGPSLSPPSTDNSSGHGPQQPNHIGDVHLFADHADATDLVPRDEKPRKKRRPRRKQKEEDMVTSEVQWQGAVMFKGNGKRITRDGPNLVITDSAAPVRRTTVSQPSRRQGRRTVAHSDTLAGHLARALTSNQPPANFSASPTAAGPRATTSSTPRKTRATPKKRKAATTKLTRKDAA